MNRFSQPLITGLLLLVCGGLAYSLVQQNQRQYVPPTGSTDWAQYPNAMLILQKSRSSCGCTPKISELALTGLSHNMDIFVFADAAAGEAEPLKKSNLSPRIRVTTKLPAVLKDRFFSKGADLVVVHARNGQIVRSAQNGVPPETFFTS